MKKYLFLLLLLVYVSPQPIFAHAFGAEYTLPIPFYLYFYGAAAALVVSFLIIGFFVNQTRKDLSYPMRKPSQSVFNKLFIDKRFFLVIKLISFSLFLLTILTGFFGVNNFEFNFNMTFFWVIFLLGTTYFTALFGNIYSVLSPFKICIEFIEYIWNEPLQGIMIFPKRFGYLPAFFFYFFLIWFELVGGTTPHKLSVIILAYTIISFLGVFIFGKKIWFEKAEFFGVFFRLLSYMSPFVYENGKLYVRAPFIELLSKTADSFTLLLFVLFMLSSTAFDGFRETTVWGSISSVFLSNLSPLFGTQTGAIVDTVFLFLSPFLFLIIYLFVLFLIKLIVKSSLSIKQLALRFAFSLVPIALVYNISHYYTLFVIQGQDIIRLVSDPFGFNWNIFRTDNFTPNIGILPTNFIWQTEVAFLLGGHIIAVYLAHIIALKLFPSHKKAVVSQFPILVLMVIYTVLGLWILSQPLSVRK